MQLGDSAREKTMMHGPNVPAWGLVLVLAVTGCLADDNDGDAEIGDGAGGNAGNRGTSKPGSRGDPGLGGEAASTVWGDTAGSSANR